MRSLAILAVLPGLALPPSPPAVTPIALAQSSDSVRVLAPKQAPQHIVVDTATSDAAVDRGGRITLYADVMPKPGIHVYAVGAPDLTPVSLVVAPRTGVRLSPVNYPAAEQVSTLGVLVPVPAYKKPFRIAQVATVSSALSSGETVVVTGVLNYQACDDRLCYPTAAVPVRWSFVVR